MHLGLESPEMSALVDLNNPRDPFRVAVHRRAELCRFRGQVKVGDHRAAEARLLLQVATLPPPGSPASHASRVSPSASSPSFGGRFQTTRGAFFTPSSA